jgi:hypothetical protein
LSAMHASRSIGSAFQGITLYAAMILLLSACAGSGGLNLTLDTRHVPAVQYLPDEVISLLDDLGYEVLAGTDAERLVRSYDDDKMRFMARDDANIRVEIDFMLNKKLTLIHLYNISEKTPSDTTVQRYNALKLRVQQEFGVDSVE